MKLIQRLQELNTIINTKAFYHEQVSGEPLEINQTAFFRVSCH